MTVQQKNHKILIVDDEPNILIALEFLLQKEGYKVFKASNGDEALESVDTHRPQIIVLDVMMPGIDGYEVAKTIRSKPENEEIRIVFLTAKGTTADKFTGYANGGEVYLTKPFDNEELVNVINEVVEFG